jgi:hypothetical protein
MPTEFFPTFEKNEFLPRLGLLNTNKNNDADKKIVEIK